MKANQDLTELKKMKQQKKITLFSLVLLIVAAIDSIRNLPASALFGSSLIFFFVFSAIVFLIPTSLVAAELSRAFPGKGGVYHWVRTAFGDKMAMLTIWLQWINTMVWYPTILSFIAGTMAYLFYPELAQNKTYLVSSILLIFWGLTFINLKGLHLSTKVNNICALFGMLLPMCLLILLGLIWWISGKPIQIQFSASSIFPSWGESANWISLTAIMASFLGMELSGVHVNEIDNPQRNFPKAIFCSVLILIATQLLGALTIAIVMPNKEIHLVDGVMQVFSDFFTLFHMGWCIPCITLLIVIGSIGSIINWLLAPAKGLLHAAEFGFLPPFFCKLNTHGVAYRILFAQGFLVSLFCLAFLLMPSINAFYWFLTGLSTQLYMIMYVFMFLAALRSRAPHFEKPARFIIPGGKFGLAITCLVGLLGCATTLIVGFFPPDDIQIASPLHYAAMIFIGILVMIAPVFLFFLYKRRSSV